MREFYPRMTPVARTIMEQVASGTVSRSFYHAKHDHKHIARKLLWDGWIEVVDDVHYDLRLTPNGRTWLERDRAGKTVRTAPV